METSIGQGKTLVTPLHMALITSAIANDGVLMIRMSLTTRRIIRGIRLSNMSRRNTERFSLMRSLRFLRTI